MSERNSGPAAAGQREWREAAPGAGAGGGGRAAEGKEAAGRARAAALGGRPGGQGRGGRGPGSPGAAAPIVWPSRRGGTGAPFPREGSCGPTRPPPPPPRTPGTRPGRAGGSPQARRRGAPARRGVGGSWASLRLTRSRGKEPARLIKCSLCGDQGRLLFVCVRGVGADSTMFLMFFNVWIRGSQGSGKARFAASVFAVIQLFVVCMKSHFKRAEVHLTKTGLVS